jgi:hypothetical protein
MSGVFYRFIHLGGVMFSLNPYIYCSDSERGLSPTLLVSILEKGYLPGYGHRRDAQIRRAELEKGWRPAYATVDKPVYGCIGQSPAWEETNCSYGDLVLQLRYSVLEKSTICIGDSLIERNQLYQSTPQKLIELYKNRKNSFLEFQCWIPIGRIEIEKVWLLHTWRVSEEWKQVCDRYHIPIELF